MIGGNEYKENNLWNKRLAKLWEISDKKKEWIINEEMNVCGSSNNMKIYKTI